MQDDYGDAINTQTAAAINARLDEGDARMTRMERELAANTAATEQVRANTADLVEVFRAAQGAFRVLNWIGKAAKPLGYIASACAACLGFWAALKGHIK